MNWLDVLILLPVLYGLIRGFMRGFVSEVIAFAVVIFGAICARIVAPPVATVFQSLFTWPEGVSDAVAYCLIFILVAVVLTMLANALTHLLNAIHLGWANSLMGAAFGLFKAYLILLIAVFVLERTNDEYHYLDHSKAMDESVLYQDFVNVANDLLYFSGSEPGQS